MRFGTLGVRSTEPVPPFLVSCIALARRKLAGENNGGSVGVHAIYIQRRCHLDELASLWIGIVAHSLRRPKMRLFVLPLGWVYWWARHRLGRNRRQLIAKGLLRLLRRWSKILQFIAGVDAEQHIGKVAATEGTRSKVEKLLVRVGLPKRRILSGNHAHLWRLILEHGAALDARRNRAPSSFARP